MDAGGFTPAYAGKMTLLLSLGIGWLVHPRIRGEDSTPSMYLIPVLGSPPHTRGRSSPTGIRATGRRFTPAYAGKIVFDVAFTIHTEVHPRIRGEDREHARAFEGVPGSPPHTRGRSTSEAPH